MLVATAGHVDHGKTQLIRALTGIDTDRLPEEKARGVSIDLGFAYADLGSGQTIGFVDVPGHEKFVRNMLAGVGAIDLALLVIAADDGLMPQTFEHLNILTLLGIDTCIAVITKIDRVNSDRVQAVSNQVNQLLLNAGMADTPVVPVSAVTDAGMNTLRSTLLAWVKTAQPRNLHRANQRFRLAIDRHFTVPGTGQVVTGAVFSGQIRVGDAVQLMPQDITLRVRALHVQNQPAQQGTTGDRCAVNIAGPALASGTIRRGQWLAAGRPVATRRIDARVTVLPDQHKPLKHWTPVHLHLGAASLTARFAPLEGREIEPGQSALAQLVTDQPTLAAFQDRFVIRDQSAATTIAGGSVVDPFGAAKGRSRPGRIHYLNILQSDSTGRVLQHLLESDPNGVDIEQFAQARNLSEEQRSELLDSVNIQTVQVRRSARGFDASRWQSNCDTTLEILSEWHREHPDQSGVEQHVLIGAMRDFAPPAVGAALLDFLTRQGLCARLGARVRLPDHMAQISESDRVLWDAVLAHVGPDDFQPPVVTELARRLDQDKSELTAFLRRAAERGQLYPVAPNRFLHPVALGRLAKTAESLISDEQTTFDARRFRDAARIGRNLTIELLEYFDSHGFTRRIGNERRILKPAAVVFGDVDYTTTKSR